jgi:hypothetical protein
VLRLLPVTVLVLACVLALTGCGATADAGDSRLAPQIEILRQVRRQVDGSVSLLTHLKVVLTDPSGRPLDDGRARVLVNGTPLRHVTATGNYYDRSSFYSATDTTGDLVRPGTEYVFQLQVDDGPVTVMGRVTTLPDIGDAEVAVPSSLPFGQPWTVRWRGVESAGWLRARWLAWRERPDGSTLTVTRMIEQTGMPAPPPGEPPPVNHFETRLAAGEGSFTVPAAYLTPSDPRERVLALFLDFKTTRSGQLESAFRAGSIVAVRQAEYAIGLAQ